MTNQLLSRVLDPTSSFQNINNQILLIKPIRSGQRLLDKQS